MNATAFQRTLIAFAVVSALLAPDRASRSSVCQGRAHRSAKRACDRDERRGNSSSDLRSGKSNGDVEYRL